MYSTAFTETADIVTSSDEYANRFAGKVGEWFLKTQEEATLKMLAPYPGASVLDVGGGHGQLTDGLVRNGYKVTVLGSSEECKSRIQPYIDNGKIHFTAGNILSLPFPDRSFDIVISYRLLAHVNKWQAFLGELSRVASKAVVLDYPEVCSLNYIAPLLFPVKKWLEGNTREFTCFRKRQLLRLFNAAGFGEAASIRQFFLPMVLHRIFGLAEISMAIEGIFRLTGLTGILGSPVILSVQRKL